MNETEPLDDFAQFAAEVEAEARLADEAKRLRRRAQGACEVAGPRAKDANEPAKSPGARDA